MASFLYWYGVLNVVALAVSHALGYLATADIIGYDLHILVGLMASLSAILGLAFLMFYFIYIGITAKEAAQKQMMEAETYYRTRYHKKVCFPWIMVAILLLIAGPVLGAAYDTGKAPLWYHHVIGWEIILVLGFVVWRSKLYLQESWHILSATFRAYKAAADRANDERSGS